MSDNMLFHKLAILTVVLLFFLAVRAVALFFRKGLPTAKVNTTIKFAILGLLVLALENWLGGSAFYGDYIGKVQSLIVVLCLANLTAYLLVDARLYYRMGKIAPAFVEELLTLLVYVVFAMAALRIIFRIDISSILTATTVMSAAIAFAMQTTIANIITGFYIQNDRNLKSKTWVAIKDKDLIGEIVKVGFRYTTIRTLDNQMAMVPNSQVMQSVVHTLGNAEENERTAVNLRVGLSYEFPPAKAIELLTRVLMEEKNISKDPPPLVTAYDFLDSSVEYNLMYYQDTYSEYRVTRGNVLRKVWYAVVREGHSFPYPHREIIRKTVTPQVADDSASVLAILRRTDLFGSLDEERYQELAGKVHVKIYGEGEAVVRQGEAGDSLFIVKRGKVNVRVDDASVGTLGEGEIFGEMSLLTGERRKATVEAEGEVRLIEISKEDIEPIIRSDPKILDGLSAILAEREVRNIENRKTRGLSQPIGTRKEIFLERLKAFFGI